MPAPIIIREVSRNDGGFDATVQFGAHGAPFEISIRNPFSDQQEQRLEWYFERWLKFPFTDHVKAEQAAGSIREYGERLFDQVIRDNPEAYVEYRALRGSDVLIEVIGSPEFHALHWEALHDPNQDRPLAVEVSVIRKNRNPVPYRAEVNPSACLRVLLVTARPGGVRDVSYRTISRPLVESLERGKVTAQVDIVRPGTFEALVNHLEDVRDEHGDGYYHIIHLDMHGSLLTYEQYKALADSHQPSHYTFRGDYAQTAINPYDGLQAFLFFEDPEAKGEGGDPVSADDVARLFNMRQVPIAVLNACQSGKQVGAAETSLGSHLITSGVQLVVAMGYSVTVSAAQKLMATLYKQLLAGRSPAVAIRRGRLELYNDKARRAAFGQQIRLEDWVLPVIYQNRPVDFDPSAFRAGAAIEGAAAYRPPRTTYRFVGRDIDILRLEALLLHRRNVQLVRGMGGAGKTTLLHHLGWWWQKTRFVEQVFYFGYDLKAYSLPEIVSQIGKQLGRDLTGRQAEDRDLVLQELKSTRHLLILDNLESVTGERLAVQNTLPPEEQAAIRDFLCELVNMRTLVLLGSRGAEAWLRPDPLRDGDEYELPGLDYEAQTELAEEILQAVGAARYPEQEEHREDFTRLLKLLGGYPLALEVVLANLARSTPAQVIERLQAADVDLDNQKEAALKTESILKCIDYSHSNLSEEAQALLLCLAPFTGVVNLGWLEQYTERLKAQPVLRDLPYGQWQAVLQEAVNWGLLKPHERLGDAGYLNLQPIFPYFLKTRLQEEAQAEMKSAIEAAFREHYKGIGGFVAQALKSKDAQERQSGHIYAQLEHENLVTSLKLSLSAAEEFYPVFDALEEYFDQQKDTANRLAVCQLVLDNQANYTQGQLQGEIGISFLSANDRLAGTYLQVKRYDLSEKHYKACLQLASQSHDQHVQSIGKASILHQLGIIAEEQRQWEQAERYFKEALEIKIEFKDRYSQASTLHQLGMVAEEQRQWEQAERYYKEALQIAIEFKDRYSQASTLHQLGMVAQEQRQWEQAERYYKEALEIYIEFKDRYSQASTLHQLGMVAQAQLKWEQATDYLLKAITILADYRDEQISIPLASLARVRRESGNEQIAEKLSEALEIPLEESEQFLAEYDNGGSEK